MKNLHVPALLASSAGLAFLACTNPPVVASPHDSNVQKAKPDASASRETQAKTSSAHLLTDAAEVLAREQRWRGGAEKLHELRDLTLVGSLSSGSKTGRVWEGATLDGFMRLHSELPGHMTLEGVDAQGAWALDDKRSRVESLPEDAIAKKRFDVRRLFARHLDEQARSASIYVGRSTIDGLECDRVRLSGTEPGVMIDECVAADGALVASCRIADGREQWAHYSQWGDVNGCRFAFREEFTGETGSSIQWVSIRANEGWQEEVLHRPSDLCVWRPAFESDVTLPIDLSQGRFVFLRGEVQGARADIMVDTGCASSMIDSEFAGRLGIESGGHATFEGGAVTYSMARNLSVRLGSFQLPLMDAEVTDLSVLKPFRGRRFEFVMGMDLFRVLTVSIDYPRRTLTLHNPKSPDDFPWSVVVPVHPLDDGQLASIDARILNLDPMQLLLDTGAGGAVCLLPWYVKEHQLLQRFPRHSDVSMIRMQGPLKGKEVHLDEFKFGDHVFHDVPMAMDTESNSNSSQAAGVIGAGILSRYLVTFDLPHGRLLLEPGDSLDAPFK
jgi:predicted aspartyl protease